LYKEVGCKAGLRWCKGEFTEFGDHDSYHQTDRQFVANIILENTVKTRCSKEHREPKDIFDEEFSK